jgi:hypothetical protein
MAVLFIMAMLWINVNPDLLRKGGILGCWRPRVFRRMNIYGDGSLENLIVVVIAGLPKPLKIAESFRPNRWVRPRQEIVQLIVQLNPECAAVIVPLYGSNTL